jgi:hypothetical protein
VRRDDRPLELPFAACLRETEIGRREDEALQPARTGLVVANVEKQAAECTQADRAQEEAGTVVR